MKKRILAAALCALLLLALCACGLFAEPEEGDASPQSGAKTDAPAYPAAPERIPAETVFPLLGAPFTDAESEAMLNHLCRRGALFSDAEYFSVCRFASGESALAHFDVIDLGLYDPSILCRGFEASYLCERGGRLYFLGENGRPESMLFDGADRRIELDAPCRSVQLFDGALCCLTEDGVLLALRGEERETLLDGCAWAFVCDEGVFYTATADGRAHLFRPADRSDLCLTAGAADGLAVIGDKLLYLTPEGEGYALCALSLRDGSEQRASAPLACAPDYLYDASGNWQVRATLTDGTEVLVPFSSLFRAELASLAPAGETRRCRMLDGDLHTDELPEAAAAGEPCFALVLPDGREMRYAAVEDGAG